MEREWRLNLIRKLRLIFNFYYFYYLGVKTYWFNSYILVYCVQTIVDTYWLTYVDYK